MQTLDSLKQKAMRPAKDIGAAVVPLSHHRLRWQVHFQLQLLRVRGHPLFSSVYCERPASQLLILLGGASDALNCFPSTNFCLNYPCC